MPLSMVVAAVELLLMVLLAYGAVKLGRMLVAESGRVLPGGRVERLSVFIIGLAVVLYFVTDTTFSNQHLGLFVFISGLSLVVAYAND